MSRGLNRLLPAVLLAGLLAGGCGWFNRPPGDPARDPNYLGGKESLAARSYEAALAHFQRAVDVNPANHLAHFELGFLYHNHLPDPVLAVYHLERYRALLRRQGGDATEDPMVAGWLHSARLRLATQFSEQIGRTLQDAQLAECQAKAARLEAQVDSLKQLVASNAMARLVQPPPATAGPVPTNRPAQSPDPAALPQARTAPPAGPTPVPANPAAGSETPARPATHTVAPGETPFAIARRHGVPLEALLRANPGLDPRRLKVGETLRLPPR